MTMNQTIASDESGDEIYIAPRNAIREELDEQIEAFLAKGGKIQNVDAHVTADPPQKPTNNYCSRPI